MNPRSNEAMPPPSGFCTLRMRGSNGGWWMVVTGVGAAFFGAVVGVPVGVVVGLPVGAVEPAGGRPTAARAALSEVNGPS